MAQSTLGYKVETSRKVTAETTQGCVRPQAWMLPRAFLFLSALLASSGCGVFDKGMSKAKINESPKLLLPAPSNVDLSSNPPGTRATTPPSDRVDQLRQAPQVDAIATTKTLPTTSPQPSPFGQTPAETGRPDYGNGLPIGTPPRGTNPAVMRPVPVSASTELAPPATAYNPTMIEPKIVVPSLPKPPEPPTISTTNSHHVVQPAMPAAPTGPIKVVASTEAMSLPSATPSMPTMPAMPVPMVGLPPESPRR